MEKYQETARNYGTLVVGPITYNTTNRCLLASKKVDEGMVYKVGTIITMVLKMI